MEVATNWFAKVNVITNLFTKVDVKVIKESLSKECILVPNLHSNHNLSKIREILKEKMEMDDTLLFTQNKNNILAEISRKDEEILNLGDIISDDNVLYLKKNLEPDWKYLNEKYELDHGRIVTLDKFEVAKQKAFVMKDCVMRKFGANGYNIGRIEYKSSEERMIKTNLFLTAEADVQEFVKLGISFGRSESEKTKSETNSTCRYIEHNKISLEFSKYLVPTDKFKNEVINAINSEDAERFKKITENFGQFIPTEVYLGGKVCFEGSKNFEGNSKENVNKTAIGAGAGTSEIKVDSSSVYSKGNSNSFEHEFFKLLGGESNCVEKYEEFNKEVWAQSLNDFRCWDCIKYENRTSIFQLLPKNLRKDVYVSAGKKILHIKTDDFEMSDVIGKFELKNIPQNISQIFQNKEAECNIFATVIDIEQIKKTTFSWKILYPSKKNEHPRIIIHCVKGFQKRKYKLKVNWMIIGYDINFNFILSDFNLQLKVLKDYFEASSSTPIIDNKKILDFEHDSEILCFGIPALSEFNFSNRSLVIGHHFYKVQEKNKVGRYIFSYSLDDNNNVSNYVNLPTFTFYILIISNFPTSDAYGILPFKCNNKSEKLFKLKQHNTLKATESNSLKSKCMSLTPKYVSLFSTGENNCGPILLKQKSDGIKTKYINDKFCEKEICICRKNDHKCVFFDPNRGI
ncbi:hypothetical protein RclHR1_17230002 [Rhizophagus clarus]|uniref:DUF7431 domain-containing protein n=1 Tax=Rhizophagus clarus TaxID=94130 RepID=A0A2Z6R043_9GLOM|nr:hypothetical protein RclHR1_17230002 [Rhizophagus clarus]GES87799.1 hypothetical protein GLOIN_2v1874430 [Rhizophagus clarus]